MKKLPDDTPICMIAGNGDLPRLVIAQCHAQSRPLFVAAVEGMTDPGIVVDCDHQFFPIGAIGSFLALLKEKGIHHLLLAGSMNRPPLSTLKPDLKGAKLLAQLLLHKQAGDDALLKSLILFFEKEGISVIGVDYLLPEILVPGGCLTKKKPSKHALENIAAGQKILHHIGDCDIGQTIAIQQHVVLGVEAIEGTDKLITRCAALKLGGEAPILVKMKKPSQDTRVDLPTIGPNTIEHLIEAGFQGIAIHAGHALILHQAKVIKRANDAGLFVTGIIT